MQERSKSRVGSRLFFNACHLLNDHLRAQLGHRHHQIASIRLVLNRHLTLGKKLARIHTSIQLENGDTSLLVPQPNAALNRGSTTKLRQQGEVNVEPAQRNSIQHGLAKNAAISDYNSCLYTQLVNALEEVWVARLAVKNRDSQLLGCLLHRAWSSLPASRTHGILAREHGNNLLAARQSAQRRNSSLWCASKQNLHLHPFTTVFEAW